MDEAYDTRIMAYRLILRLAPVVHAARAAADPRETARFFFRIDQFSATIYSSFVAFSPELLEKLIQRLIRDLPMLCDQFLDEGLTALSALANSSARTQHKERLILNAIGHFVPPDYLETMKSTLFTPYSLVQRLLAVFPVVTSLQPDMAIWHRMVTSAKALTAAVDFLIDAAKLETH
jgi:hypothetical protein